MTGPKQEEKIDKKDWELTVFECYVTLWWNFSFREKETKDIHRSQSNYEWNRERERNKQKIHIKSRVDELKKRTNIRNDMEIATNFKRSSKTHFDICVCVQNAKHFDKQIKTCCVNKKNIVAKLLDTKVFFLWCNHSNG